MNKKISSKLHIFPYHFNENDFYDQDYLDSDDVTFIYFRGEKLLKTLLDENYVFYTKQNEEIKTKTYYWRPEFSKHNKLMETFNFIDQETFE